MQGDVAKLVLEGRFSHGTIGENPRQVTHTHLKYPIGRLETSYVMKSQAESYYFLYSMSMAV